MTLLKIDSGIRVRSLDEMFAIGRALEREAAARYEGFASHLRKEGMTELAELFARLAQEEREHERSVGNWAQQQTGKQPDSADIGELASTIFEDDTGREIAASRTATAYRILSMAVRNEDRSFSFWSYVAAEAPSAEIREAAERMAMEELRHAAILRRARRRAYQADRTVRLPDAALSVGDRIAEAAQLEQVLAERLKELAARLTGVDRQRAEEFAAQSSAAAARLGRGPGPTPTSHALGLAATAERLVENYLDIADRAPAEETALQMQALAGAAIRRLSWVRDVETARRT